MTKRRAPASSGSPLSFARYCPIMLSDSGLWSIRLHTHEQRSALLPAVVRRLEDRFGHGLLAVAVHGSYARGDDGPIRISTWS
jgi:hypothetical protein